ncbi:ankyrin-1-like isoform X1 [Salvia splendens]|uniref:ankyrin-1-like isoform X1 n=1 Tax=Salvia splendens TaxID=180675 RepID=UPI001C27B56D|nr:ankyrin-1-like isoform X1 [Salvia splendens]
MDSSSEIAIRNKFDDEWEFRKICDEYSDFSTGRSVLHHAVGIGHFDVCKFLINTVRVDIDVLTYKSSLSLCSLASSLDIYAILIKTGDTPLTEAAKRGHVKIVEFLVKHGAEISLPNIEGFTALHYAALNNNKELVELLRIKGAHIETDSVDGTPLQVAASRGNAEADKSLLSHGANLAFYCAVSDTPLVCAVKSRSFECLNVLLEAGANPNLYYTGLSPLSSAAKEGDTKFLKRLLEAKADPNSFQADIFQPIEDAAMVRNRAAVEILFPVTKRLVHHPKWTVDGIIEHSHSEEFKTMMKKKMINILEALELGGKQDVINKEYNHSIVKYRMATRLDLSNATWVLKQSVCEARMGLRTYALFDAQKCIRLKPNFAFPHHEGEIANEIAKKFLMACLAFSLDPYSMETSRAFRGSLFDYFVWLSQMSSMDDILNCILS